MLTIFVAVFVRDRLDHVRLCTEWLMKDPDPTDTLFHFVAFDDHSTDSAIDAYLSERYPTKFDVPHDAVGQLADRRIGFARSFAVDVFINKANYDILMLLDSDIIVSKSTIAQAAKDFKYLKANGQIPGGLTLYALSDKYLDKASIFKSPSGVFQTATLTGDAHMLFDRQALLRVGNHFSADSGGFADNHIKAIADSGLLYWTRIDPAYQVQHIGYGNGASTVYSEKPFDPFWTTRPYWAHNESKSVIQVPGFDVLQYTDLVNRFGGLEAPKRYLEMRGVK